MHRHHRALVGLATIVALTACEDTRPAPTAVTHAQRTLNQQAVLDSMDSLAPQGPYVAVDLGTLGGASGTAFAVNKDGSVVGTALDSSGNGHAFLWRNGVMQDLGTLGGTFSQATDINDRGDIVGTSTTAEGVSYAVLWTNGTIQALGPIAGGTVHLNRGGDAVWSATTPSGTHAYLWHNGAAQDLGTLGGATSNPTAINDAGSVVGTSSTDSDGTQAFIWSNGQMQEIPSPVPQVGLSPVGINRHGLVAGTIRVFGVTPWQKAWTWDGSAVTMIPVRAAPQDSNGNAAVVSDRGDVYGVDFNIAGDNQHPFEWTNGTLIRIDPSWFLAQFVTAVNPRGTVTGYRLLGPPAQVFRAMVWEDGNAWILGTFAPGGESRGLDVNAQGDVVGVASTKTGSHPALWKRVP
ncbi:MAG TPA: hypothetical protein VJS20_01335 [Gemmatimonadales bacterium]|nr:hypothetical protein [Gemmatimonadales bacterium]